MNLDLCPKHRAPLKSTKISSKCHACYEDNHNNKQGYKCDICNFYVHEECINPDIPSRHKHPLKLRTFPKRFECCLCKIKPLAPALFNKILQTDWQAVAMFYEFQQSNWKALLYECLQCDFRICIDCARKTLIFYYAKAHKHELHQVSMKLTFTCDACGLCTSDYPCICHQCCFITHRECIILPRIININRHDHRISHVSSLGPGNWICGVCREPVNAECGAYSCLICSYAVHSMCATHGDIWDGNELEGIPEEEEESKSFQVIDQNIIKHFSHQHNLKVSQGFEEDKHCYACTLPFDSERCYRCTQCDFILHDACANLHQRKRHPISSIKLTLCTKFQDDNYFVCDACKRFCTGFLYTGGYHNIDVNCASITDAFKHESHPHWLYPFKPDFSSIRSDTFPDCKICDSSRTIYLRCINQDGCDGFTLCFTCATLPTLVRHKYDDHPLSLCYSEKNGISTYWCGICEEEINSKNGFYCCHDCDSTLHTNCVYKDLLHQRPILRIRDQGTFNVLPNDSLSRPTCYLCKTRCLGDWVLRKDKTATCIFMCSSCAFCKQKYV